MKNQRLFSIKKDLVCYANDKESWQCPIKEIKCIGEFTNNHGQFEDDYFIVFFTKEFTYTGSFYAENRIEVMNELSKTLNCKLETKLIGSTDWASNVLYPVDIISMPVYKDSPKPPKNLYEKAKEKLFGGKSTWEIADYVKAKLN